MVQLLAKYLIISERQRNHGMALPAMLLGAAALALFAAWGAQSLQRSTAAMGSVLLADRYYQRAVAHLLQNTTYCHDPTESLDCRRTQQGEGRHRLDLSLCALCRAPQATNPRPLLAYNQIFETAFDCCQLSNRSSRPLTAPQLSPQGLSAICTCIFNSLPPEHLRLRGNLLLNGVEQLSVPIPEAAAYLIAATGWIKIEPHLLSQSSLAILAGGDLSITAISSFPPADPTIELFSASGALHLGTLSGPTLLRAYAPYAHRLPLTPISATPKFLPTINHYFLGFHREPLR